MLSIEDVLPLHVADITFPENHPLSGQVGAIFAFAIRDVTGLVLFETGIGRGREGLDSRFQVVHRPIEEELARHGHHIGDVRAIANSHLHFDHCGSNLLFPGVPIYVQSIEFEAAHQPNYTVLDWVDFSGAEYRKIDGDEQIAPGLKLLATPGHAPGHQSMLLETSAGQVVLAGQAIYSKAEYDHIRITGEVPPDDPAPDPEQYQRSAKRLIELHAYRVLFSHDAAAWNSADIGASQE